MVGITLSPEQIRAAPPEVRRWLEHEIASILGPLAPPSSSATQPPTVLADLTPEEAARIFALVQSDYFACQVLFELGREMPDSRSGNGLHAFSIAEIGRHTRLSDVERLAGCFGAISAAFQQVRGDVEATLFGFDQFGCCFVSEATHQAIRLLWQDLVSARAPRDAYAKAPAAQAGAPVQSRAEPNPAPQGHYGGPDAGIRAVS